MANITERITPDGTFHRYGIGLVGLPGAVAEVEAKTPEAGLAAFVAEERAQGVERDPKDLRVFEVGYDHVVTTLVMRFISRDEDLHDIERTVSCIFEPFGVAQVFARKFSLEALFHDRGVAMRALEALRTSATEAAEFLRGATINGKAV